MVGDVTIAKRKVEKEVRKTIAAEQKDYENCTPTITWVMASSFCKRLLAVEHS